MPGIAIIGCGLIGETHAECLAQLGSAPVAFFDLDFERASKLAAKYGATPFADYDDVLGHPMVEAVYICTYHDTHASYAIKAASAKKHIFLEKPMAITQNDCAAIVQAVQANGVFCMTGFKLHHSSLVQKAFDLLPDPIILVANVFDERWPDDIWANDPKRGGGNVLSQGCHAVELLIHFARSKPRSVFAFGGNLNHKAIAVTDSVACSIQFDSGAIANLTVADAGAMPHNGKFLIRFANGVKSIELYDRLTKLTYFDGNTTHEFTSSEDGFLNENIEFLSVLKEGRQPATNEDTGLEVQRVLFAAIESVKSHQPQSL